MKNLHPKAVWLFFLQHAIGVLILLLFTILFLIFAAIIFEKPGLAEMILKIFTTPVYIGFMIYVFLVYIWARLAYKNYRYEITEEGIKIERGVIWKHYVMIPFERIQNIDIHRGIFDRLLGLSDLHIYTAGYSFGYAGGVTEGRLPGLLPKDAEDLREELVKKMKGTKPGL